jgi:oligopeptide transport system ATP-binding protein
MFRGAEVPGRSDESLLDVRELDVRYGAENGEVWAVRQVTFGVRPAEIVAIVGESGSGKSTTALSLLRLLPTHGVSVKGTAMFRGIDLLAISDREMRSVRGGRIGMVFQDPLSALDPVASVGSQVAESLSVHQDLRGRAARRRVIELLELVGIPNAMRRVHDYPHQFSGGMRQRVVIASAIAAQPALLIADEPTSSLDVTIQAQILDLLLRLRSELGMAVLIITHNLGVVAAIVDRVHVMYGGRMVEIGPTEAVLSVPRHPYTLALVGVTPSLDPSAGRRLVPINGLPPDLREEDYGCAFAPRCSFAVERCAKRPLLSTIGPERSVACWEHHRLLDILHPGS